MLEESPVNALVADDSEKRRAREYVAVFRRRKGEVIAVAVLVAIVVVVVAMWLPPVYRSAATILVQEQEIPPDLVRSTITSFADERIQVISQQVMTRTVLLQLVDKYDLYSTFRHRATEEEIVERMRKDIKLSTIDSNISDRGSGRRVNATIAFQISYDSVHPDRARQVVNDLVSLFLSENVKARQQSVAEINAFLGQEAERVAEQLRGIEANLAAFKRRYASSLPDSMGVNMQLAERTSAELQQVDREMAMLQDRRLALEAQMLFVKPRAQAPGDAGDRDRTPEDRLRALRAQYTASAAVYGADHPDLRRMQREIAALEAQTGKSAPDADASGQLAELETRLAALKKQYSDDHPDVQRTARSIAALKAARGPDRSSAAGADAAVPDNPAYIALSTQLDSVKRELASLAATKENLRARQRGYDARLLQTPEVEREYRDLTRDYENAQTRYREIRGKQMQAEVAQELEKDRKAERFSLAEPANLPGRPVSPNRVRIVMLGLVGALGAGLGFAWLREAADPSVKGPLDLARITRLPMLTPIPYIETQRERTATLRRRYVATCVAALSCTAVLIALHFAFRPLPQLFARLVGGLTFW